MRRARAPCAALLHLVAAAALSPSSPSSLGRRAGATVVQSAAQPVVRRWDDAPEAEVVLPESPFPGETPPWLADGAVLQLEEREHDESAMTALVLHADGTLALGRTDGPLCDAAVGLWQCGGDSFQMVISRKFTAGLGANEISYSVAREYVGDVSCRGNVSFVDGRIDMERDAFFDGVDAKSAIGYFTLSDARGMEYDVDLDTEVKPLEVYGGLADLQAKSEPYAAKRPAKAADKGGLRVEAPPEENRGPRVLGGLAALEREAPRRAAPPPAAEAEQDGTEFESMDDFFARLDKTIQKDRAEAGQFGSDLSRYEEEEDAPEDFVVVAPPPRAAEGTIEAALEDIGDRLRVIQDRVLRIEDTTNIVLRLSQPPPAAQADDLGPLLRRLGLEHHAETLRGHDLDVDALSVMAQREQNFELILAQHGLTIGAAYKLADAIRTRTAR